MGVRSALQQKQLRIPTGAKRPRRREGGARLRQGRVHTRRGHGHRPVFRPGEPRHPDEQDRERDWGQSGVADHREVPARRGRDARGCARAERGGTPQGGPLSPLLANIYLDALDKELEKRGLRFARYADDCNIYTKSARAAQRVLESLTGWIKRHLRLEVSEKKSGTGRPWERKFLGFVITTALLISIAPGSLTRFKTKVREHWSARQSQTSTQLRDQWQAYVRGWWGYYRLCEDRRPILRIEGWIRRHIRKCFWQRWHSSTGREAALKRLGVPAHRAGIGRCTRGAWGMARHPTMQEALNNKTLRRYEFIMPSDLG